MPCEREQKKAQQNLDVKWWEFGLIKEEEKTFELHCAPENEKWLKSAKRKEERKKKPK